jgi:hypothetical protein
MHIRRMLLGVLHYSSPPRSAAGDFSHPEWQTRERLVMTAIVHCGRLVSFLLFSIACTNADRPTAPSTPPPPAIQPRRGGEWPPLSGSATIYHAVSAAAGTRYVLYENGAFSLQFGLLGGSSMLAFIGRRPSVSASFSPATSGGPPIGTLKGDLLEVRHNDIMEHSDFVNGVYQRSP